MKQGFWVFLGIITGTSSPAVPIEDGIVGEPPIEMI